MIGNEIELKERSGVEREDKWDVEALYPSLAEWEKELVEVARPDQRPRWPELVAFKGRLGEGTVVFKEFLDKSFAIDRKLSNLYTYAHMRADEDVANEEHKRAHSMILAIYYEFGEELAWAEPEILALPKETIKGYLNDPQLKEYHTHLERVVRMKPHTLSSEKEELLALGAKALTTPGKAFGALNNADLKFPQVENEKGEEKELTHGKYLVFMRSRDRVLRKNAFQTLHTTFVEHENTLTELMNGHVQSHLFGVRARGYRSCLESALFPNQIDTSVYTNLVQTVRKHLPVLHRYMEVRKEGLALDELHMYDMYVPLLEDVALHFDFNQATKLVIDSVAPLGEEYQQALKKGLLEERWVDRYENKRKRSGAYSCGSYDSSPFILMNFHGEFHDLMTLAHEAGHSMHSLHSHKHQPYQYSSYPIFLAEVASTFNEELLFHHLMQQDLSDKEKAFLINQKIEDIRATFFRQTMFAEFELLVHTLAEENIPLTPGLLKERYRQLNRDYFGPEVTLDEEIDIEWARIPHFYSNFYVYQYATGISAAHALFERVMEGGEEGKKDYLAFLCAGCSDYPLDILQRAGVNMRQEGPIEATIKQFDRLVGELKDLTQ
ncbi:MAG: Oligoendopeptidase F, plasmid [Chlamydiae bacterium]|nr:Oligoendopeptidase F, plasmid [Chlamydiota bacterium]